jgi:hypothetical protein
MTDLFLDLLPPGQPANSSHAFLGRVMKDRLYIPETDSPGAIKRALNDNAWVDGDVIAAGDVRQGKEPSVVSMLTGFAAVEALRSRRLKALPRHFVLAVTREHVVAFNTLSTGDEDDLYELWVRPAQVGSWPRESVRVTPLAKPTAATLEIAGACAPVHRASDDPSTEELFALLAGS